MENDFDRLLFFEHARRTAEVTYTKNPLDTEQARNDNVDLHVHEKRKREANLATRKWNDVIEIESSDDENLFDGDDDTLDDTLDDAPELHAELHKQGSIQQAMGPVAGGGPSTSSSIKGPKTQKSSDLTYDILGWAILAVTIVAWVGFAKANVPPPPSR
ncbi:plant specific mitochondrial import receptor subunit TOM20 [Artemisia annua]|uniref:Plant specific mitochondrial import receptor subunit TOM20 n=1 Tax=Artemisia annua TaxID=35608 RepID=A0A2U1KI26_ARTAN|nr:plant specific mitochondrial import receptor subunit TOM20 [Artemisia annua]